MRTSSSLGRGFSVSLHEVFALFLTRFVSERETRSRMIMAQFAVFVEGFVFGDAEAAEIGRFVSSAQLPIDDMCVPHPVPHPVPAPRSRGPAHLPTHY